MTAPLTTPTQEGAQPPFDPAVVVDLFRVPEMGAGPNVRVISVRTGHVPYPGNGADRTPDGRYARSIITVAESERFGLHGSDSFV